MRKLIKNFEEALKWIDVASLKGTFPRLDEKEDHIFDMSRLYHKGVLLKNIGENLGHINKYVEMTSKFNEVVNLLQILENNYEKFRLLINLAVAYRRLGKFEEEREYLNKALDFTDDTTPLEQIEQRIRIFEETKMSTNKLLELENEEKVNLYYSSSVFLSKINNLKLSIAYNNRSLKKTEKLSNQLVKNRFYKNIFRNKAISYFLLRDWENSKENLNQYLSIEKDFESELYHLITLYSTGERQKSEQLLKQIMAHFKEVPNDRIFFDNWVVQIMNSLSEELFLQFIADIEKLNEEIQELFFFNFGNSLGNHGFSELAIQFFKREFDFISDEKQKATIYNDIAGIYSDMDEYESAIENFKKALELDNEYDLCYRNLAEIYSRKLDNINAKINLEKAIELGKIKGKPEIKIYQLKLKQVNLLLKDVLNINDIKSLEIRNILTSTEKKFVDYRNMGDNFDTSDIILGFSRAIERMLNEEVGICFEPLVKQYRQLKKKTTDDFNKKFNCLFQGKSITLGTWIRILEDFKNDMLEPDVREFKVCLDSIFNRSELDIIQKMCELIIEERNDVAHGKLISIKKIMLIRKWIIPFLNQTILILYGKK